MRAQGLDALGIGPWEALVVVLVSVALVLAALALWRLLRYLLLDERPQTSSGAPRRPRLLTLLRRLVAKR